MSDDHDFESTTSGAAEATPLQCSALRKNGNVILKGRPCKIVEMSTSKTGKHGHAKVHLVGIDIFNKKKYEDICPSTHNMQVPNVVRKEYTVSDLDEDGYLTLMNDCADLRSDLKLHSDLNMTKDEIRECIDSGIDLRGTVVSAMGLEQVMELKKG